MLTAWLLHLKASRLTPGSSISDFLLHLIGHEVTWLSLLTRNSGKVNIFSWAHRHPGQNWDSVRQEEEEREIGQGVVTSAACTGSVYLVFLFSR